jgi:titin
LPTLVANGTVIDGSTQPGFTNKPLIVVDASQIIPETLTSDTFLIYSASNQIKNVSFSGFNWNGMTLEYADATNNTISGCWFGVGSGGTNAAPNAYQGILVCAGASRNIIGGTNVLSGNSQYGIFITDSNTAGNVVLGNYIGTTAGGTNALPNALSGVFIGNGTSGNIIGGTNALARNVLSGNSQSGLIMTSNTTGNVVLGNYIGTDASGSHAVSNILGGVFLAAGASQNLIGGTNAGAGNVISGNLGNGILMRGSDVVNNAVQGNYIGTDATGLNPLPNTVAGVTIDTGSSSNLIGGTVVGSRNVISGNNLNADYGVIIANPGTRGNVVEGNYIGLGADGVTAVPNVFGMVCSDGATSNTFGGTVAGARNVISGNLSEGLRLTDAGTMANAVQGNFIGTDLTGENALPNNFAGLTIYAGATSSLIGGTTAGARNIISGNKQYGIYISDPGTSNNFVLGNFIGPDVTGTNAIGDGGFGIGIWNSASGNFIGGTSGGAGNLISGNPGFSYGVALGGVNGNIVQGNFIGTDPTGTNALANGFANVAMWGGSTGNLVGGTGAGAGNVIAFSGGYGVVVYDPGTTNNSIRGNSIFNNGYLGVDLNGDGVTLNHAGFLAGPNDLQNFPVITNAYGFAASTIVSGTLNSLANGTFFIDVYRNIAHDPSGYGQGQFYVGTVSVTSDGSGNASFALTNAAGNYAGQYFTATATTASGDTSEFGADMLAINASAPSVQLTGPFQPSANGFAFSMNLQPNFSYRIQAATNLTWNPVPWIDLTNFTPAISTLNFTDRTATNFRVRFYRAISP